MKKLLFVLSLSILSFTASAQSTMNIDNQTNCDLEVSLRYFSTGTCTYINYLTVVVASGTTTAVTAPAGSEFVEGKFSGFPYCPGTVQAYIGTPTTPGCNSTCTSGYANYFVGPSSGCAGCDPTINAKWDDCYAPGEGILTIIDF